MSGRTVAPMSTSTTPTAVSTSTPFDRMYDALADGIADRGVRAHEESVAAFARRAAQLGLSPTLIEIVTDRNAAEPVRQRAFGLLALRLAAVERTTSRPSIFAAVDRDAA
jgi:hypothetical protein